MWGQIDFGKVGALPTGNLAGFIGGISIILAGLGIGYVAGGADYTRYLPKRSSSSAIVGWTTLGASLPQVILMIFGVFLTASNTDLATTADPIGALAKPLPTWFLVPYMIVAVGGLVAATVVNLYSSGLSLMALGVKLPRYRTVLVDAALMVVGCSYLLFFSSNFFGPLSAFLVTLGVPLAAWTGIFLVDMFTKRQAGYIERDFYNRSGVYGAFGAPALTSLVVSTVVGLGLVTSSTGALGWEGYLLGPFGGKTGAIGSSSIGIAIALALGAVLYWALSATMQNRTPQAAAVLEERIPAGRR